MVTHEDNCVGCPTEIGCVGSVCPFSNASVLTCDECGKETDELYEVDFDNDQRCLDCLLDVVGARKVER